jgi:hypothetical protein
VDLEIGKTYLRRPIPTWPKERQGVVVRHDDLLAELRDPHTCLHFTERVGDLEGPVEPIPPPPVCPTCLNSREIPCWVSVADKPWLEIRAGFKDCPCCDGEQGGDIDELREVVPKPHADFG